ncbi:MAG: peptide deformylase [Chloroflexi bacterium]|nr:peptide deformylase [Chloroflexota bacterium]
MSVLPIRTLHDPVLRQKSKRVKTIDGSIQKLIENMLETVRAAPGRAGLAAPQVGTSLRVIVIDIPGAENVVLINPEIVKRSGERPVTEGCLSVPGYYGEIKRAESVTAKGRDASGKEIRIKAEELLAQALEHEIDHLNGILYIDHLESQDKLYKVEDEVPQL